MLGRFLIVFWAPTIHGDPCYCDNYDITTDICYQFSSNCLSLYSYCVQTCPTGFQQLNSTCIEDGQSLKIIDTSFKDTLTLNTDKAGNFQTSLGTFLDSINPKPTKDRGFYFDSSSFLQSTSDYIISPALTIKLYFKALSDGIILKVNQVFSLEISSNNIVAYFFVKQQTNSCNVNSLSHSEQIQLNQWNRLIFILFQFSSTQVFSLFLIMGLIFDKVEPNVELVGTNMEKVHVGDNNKINSVTGFLYKLEIWNTVDINDLIDEGNSECPFLAFQEGSQCKSCNIACGSINCVRGNNCNTCRSSNCDQCFGYGIDDCQHCDNGETAPWCCDFLCESCSQLWTCKTCNSGYYLDSVVCIPEMPTGFSSSKILPYKALSVSFKDRNWSQFFDSFLTDASFPVKVRNRGLYFDGNANLKYSTNFVLSAEFSLQFLIKAAMIRTPIINFPGFLTVYTIQDILSIKLTTYKGVSDVVNMGLSFE